MDPNSSINYVSQKNWASETYQKKNKSYLSSSNFPTLSISGTSSGKSTDCLILKNEINLNFLMPHNAENLLGALLQGIFSFCDFTLRDPHYFMRSRELQKFNI